MAQTAPIHLPTDPETTEALSQAMAQAQARGVSLGRYLKSVLPMEPSNHGQHGASIQEWTRAFREWAFSRPDRGSNVDDSREAIYGDDE
jgi:hypothetical protein